MEGKISVHLVKIAQENGKFLYILKTIKGTERERKCHEENVSFYFYDNEN